MTPACVALILILLALPAAAASPDTQNYRRAFALINSGHVLEAGVFAARGRDPILNKVIHAIYMAEPGNDVSFAEMADFIAANPDWPDLRGIVAIAEQKLPAAMSGEQVLAWFAAHPPVSLAGLYHDIDVLNASGQTRAASDLVRSRWIEGEFTPDEFMAFRTRFGALLGDEENAQRLDRLLWKNDVVGVRQLYSYLDPGRQALAQARLGLAHIRRMRKHWSSACRPIFRTIPVFCISACIGMCTTIRTIRRSRF